MIIGNKYCFECGKRYPLDDRNRHVCVMEDAPREVTITEIRTVIREELALFWKMYDPHIRSWPPRPACDGDLGWPG